MTGTIKGPLPCPEKRGSKNRVTQSNRKTKKENKKKRKDKRENRRKKRGNTMGMHQ